MSSVNFCTVDFGGVFFNSFYCVPCVLLGTLVLRSTKFIFCVKAALLAKRACVACFTSWFSEQYIMSTHASRKLRCVGNTLVQATQRVGSINFWSFTVAWTAGGGGVPPPPPRFNFFLPQPTYLKVISAIMPLNKSTTYHAPPPHPGFNFFAPTYIPQSDQHDEAVILSHICWVPYRPPLPP